MKSKFCPPQSLDDVARRNGIGRSTIYEAIRRGELTARKIGRRTIVLPADEQAWLERLPRVRAA